MRIRNYDTLSFTLIHLIENNCLFISTFNIRFIAHMHIEINWILQSILNGFNFSCFMFMFMFIHQLNYAPYKFLGLQINEQLQLSRFRDPNYDSDSTLII